MEAACGCPATFERAETVHESFAGRPVWEGEVDVFRLTGHPTALQCYAWSSPVPGTTRQRDYTVLHSPPVDSAQAAVRAAIVSDYRSVKQ